MNRVLLQSSVFHGIILWGLIAVTYPQLPVWIIVGIILVVMTSCWNHGSTNKIAKWCDRVITAGIALILLYVLLTEDFPYSEYIGLGIVLAGVLWLSSYQYVGTLRNRLHWTAHTVATVSIAAFLLSVLNQPYRDNVTSYPHKDFFYL
jgi:hypothetical protein